MVGYCSTGSACTASSPASEIESAITQAKIGRSMKNLASIGWPPRARRAAGAPSGTGLTGAPGRTFWSPSTITLSPAAGPSVMTQDAAGQPAELDRPRLGDVAGADDHDAAAGRSQLNCALRDGDAVRIAAGLDPDANELARQQQPLRIAEGRAQADAAGGRVHRLVEEVERAGEAVGLPSSSSSRDRARAIGGARPRAAQREQLLARLREVDVDRVELLDRVSSVPLAWLASAPSVTSARPTRPAIGAVTVV
jgi:hypothetical protein